MSHLNSCEYSWLRCTHWLMSKGTSLQHYYTIMAQIADFVRNRLGELHVLVCFYLAYVSLNMPPEKHTPTADNRESIPCKVCLATGAW